ncbi:MAG TPA: universal stress protein [Gaiellaceae bacterium]|jgi:nucleotide-binding universal stress UspA family protein|nr:universal stress protein [Gaiellaceae bacterium]
MKTIVLGYDDTEPSMRALRRVVELAKAFDAFVVAVSVARALVPAGHGIGPIDPADPPELHREELHHAKALLDELDIAADYEVGLGDPADLILKAAEKRGADMIVVGTSEPGLISRLLGLSASETVQRRAHCDVLIVH